MELAVDVEKAGLPCLFSPVPEWAIIKIAITFQSANVLAKSLAVACVFENQQTQEVERGRVNRRYYE